MFCRSQNHFLELIAHKYDSWFDFRYPFWRCFDIFSGRVWTQRSQMSDVSQPVRHFHTALFGNHVLALDHSVLALSHDLKMTDSNRVCGPLTFCESCNERRFSPAGFNERQRRWALNAANNYFQNIFQKVISRATEHLPCEGIKLEIFSPARDMKDWFSRKWTTLGPKRCQYLTSFGLEGTYTKVCLSQTVIQTRSPHIGHPEYFIRQYPAISCKSSRFFPWIEVVSGFLRIHHVNKFFAVVICVVITPPPELWVLDTFVVTFEISQITFRLYFEILV